LTERSVTPVEDARAAPYRDATRIAAAFPSRPTTTSAAATAFAAGLDVATENRGDFGALAEALVALFPDAPALAVVDGPLRSF